MASARLLEYKRRADKIPTRIGRAYTMSINSDAHDLSFRRAQSQRMQNMAWENRAKPLMSWFRIAALFIGFAVFMAACVFLATI